MAIRDREYYLEELKKRAEAEVKLAEANLKLLEEREKKLLAELDVIKSTKAEWVGTKEEEEDKLANPDPVLTRMLARDFRAEIALRKSGGARDLSSRYGESVYGIKFQNRNRRKALVPRLKRDGERSWYENEEAEVETRRSNEEAWNEWQKYMDVGLEIPASWSFNKLVAAIQKFFDGVPSLDVFGPSYEVYAETGELYQPLKVGEKT